jgi:hypothetical protein
MVIPHLSRQNKDVATSIMNTRPPRHVPLSNTRDVLEDSLINETRVGFGDVQPCPFGVAYIQFAHFCDRDKMIRENPIPFMMFLLALLNTIKESTSVEQTLTKNVVLY